MCAINAFTGKVAVPCSVELFNQGFRSWPSGKIGPCVQRGPTGRANIVIVIERVIEREEKDREISRERERETSERRETPEERHEK